MEATDTSWWAWGIATVLGPVVLAIALIYGIKRTRPASHNAPPQGPIPPEERTINAASWGAEDKLFTRPQPDTDPVGARMATKQQVPEREQQSEREKVIQLDDRSRG